MTKEVLLEKYIVIIFHLTVSFVFCLSNWLGNKNSQSLLFLDPKKFHFGDLVQFFIGFVIGIHYIEKYLVSGKATQFCCIFHLVLLLYFLYSL